MLSATDGRALVDDLTTHHTDVWRFVNGRWRLWNKVPVFGSGCSPLTIEMVSPTDGWIGTNYCHVFHSDGTSWELVTVLVPYEIPGNEAGCSISVIQMLSPWEGWFGGCNEALYYYQRGWVPSPRPPAAGRFCPCWTGR